MMRLFMDSPILGAYLPATGAAYQERSSGQRTDLVGFIDPEEQSKLELRVSMGDAGMHPPLGPGDGRGG